FLLSRCLMEKTDYLHHRKWIMERRGEGVGMILQNSKRLSGQLPSWRLIDDELLLVIPAAA
ncbi:MAG: transcriptional regulator, partial [Betaproteobacteria bacterium]|nr:transcriptional regulator [Betaproteobacteria bacterium]